MNKFKSITMWIILIVLLYVAISMTSYAFRHPEETDTQRILNMDKAVFWK